MSLEGLEGPDGCEICSDTWDDAPPCDECVKRQGLFSRNAAPWRIWQDLSRTQRPRMAYIVGAMGGIKTIHAPLPVKATDVADLCDRYGLGEEEYERILTLDAALYPRIKEIWDAGTASQADEGETDAADSQ